MEKKIVVIFGSSRTSEGEIEYERARELGRLLAKNGFTVCNGGYGGTMEAAARGAKEAGGRTIGVIAEMFSSVANRWIDEVINMKTFSDRLLKLVELGDIYIALKGGTGTLVELSMVWEMMNKRLIPEKPIIALDFWNKVVDTLKEELIWEGLGSCTQYVTVAQTPEKCVTTLLKKLDMAI